MALGVRVHTALNAAGTVRPSSLLLDDTDAKARRERREKTERPRRVDHAKSSTQEQSFSPSKGVSRTQSFSPGAVGLSPSGKRSHRKPPTRNGSHPKAPSPRSQTKTKGRAKEIVKDDGSSSDESDNPTYLRGAKNLITTPTAPPAISRPWWAKMEDHQNIRTTCDLPKSAPRTANE